MAQPRAAARGSGSRLVIARGPLAVEQALLAELARTRQETRNDPKSLARPVRVVVPSRALRLHLGARIARELGACAGLLLQTLHGLALEILARAGERASALDEWIGILARRHAREFPELARRLDSFEDGFRGVASTVRDLLDAGLEPGHEGALLDRLAGVPGSSAQRERARALVAIALRVARELEPHACRTSGELLRRARTAVERDPGLLPTRALIVHGFADATGRALLLLEALLGRFEGRLFLDHPDDPAVPPGGPVQQGRADPGLSFTARLRARLEPLLGGAADAMSGPASGSAAPRPTARALFRAPGPEAEAREVARRIRELLDRGAIPEGIAIVARELGPHRSLLSTHLTRLGVSFSAPGTRAQLDGPGRKLQALSELLSHRSETACDRWLDSLGALRVERQGNELRRSPSVELRLALRVLGAAQLGDVGTLEPSPFLEDGRYPLPVRSRVVAGDPGAASARARRFSAVQRKADGSELAGARRAARSLLARLERWPERAAMREHLLRLARLRRRDLAWRARDLAEIRARAALERFAEALPDAQLTRAEFALLAARALASAAPPPLGGAGGGVQVLDAMEARGRTFEHLFLIGVNRDVFPRVQREDPLLPDVFRRALEPVLPAIPIKARGRAEERFLFAQLCGASPALTISWQLCDEDGKRQGVSPLIDRLLGGEEGEPETVPPLHPEHDDAPRPRTAAEDAVLAGLRAGGSARVEPLLALALQEADIERPGPIARAHALVLEAHERGPFEPRALGPWLGFLGGQAPELVRPDPRRELPAITRIEALARCPWQAVLTRFLRLDEGFEALDGAGRVDPRAVGMLVHGFLERLALDHMGSPRAQELAGVLARAPVRVPWPEPAELEERLERAAREVFRNRPAPAGLVRWLSERARPHLERARAILEDEAQHGGGVLGVEVDGAARLPGEDGTTHEVTFRADRVERLGEQLVLTDFKTGKPLSRSQLLREALPRGTHLQSLVYALAARELESDARGRYLFLDARGASADPSVGFGETEAARAALERVLRSVRDAWLAGAFFPRLVDAEKEQEPDACRLCSVSQACLRGDSGARRALVSWTGESLDTTEAVVAMRALWQLARGAREEER